MQAEVADLKHRLVARGKTATTALCKAAAKEEVNKAITERCQVKVIYQQICSEHTLMYTAADLVAWSLSLQYKPVVVPVHQTLRHAKPLHAVMFWPGSKNLMHILVQL